MPEAINSTPLDLPQVNGARVVAADGIVARVVVFGVDGVALDGFGVDGVAPFPAVLHGAMLQYSHRLFLSVV